jgi:hypothetical protein
LTVHRQIRQYAATAAAVELLAARRRRLEQTGTSELTFREVRRLVEKGFRNDTDLLDAVDRLLGVALVLSPLALGPAALPALSLIGAKNELVKLGQYAVKKVAARGDGDFLETNRRMAAACCLITFTAYFDALQEALPSVLKQLGLTSWEKLVLARDALDRQASTADLDPAHVERGSDLTSIAIPFPHPLIGPWGDDLHRKGLYEEMTKGFLRLLNGLSWWEGAGADVRTYIRGRLAKVPEAANEMFASQYYRLAADHEQFFVWSNIHAHKKTQALTEGLSQEVRRQATLVEAASTRVDLGLAKLQAAIEAQPVPPSGADRVCSELHAMYAASVAEPIIDDKYAGGEEAVVVYPKKSDIFVPQAFKAVRYEGASVHLEDEGVWQSRPVQDDLGRFLLHYLSTPYSAEAPLLILGHPGSGKSLLTEMFAARLAPPHFNPVRLELRDTDPEADVQTQIEEQIREDTGRTVNWADVASQLRGSPPVVILDGYDELLQASGQVYGNYLTKVQKFQRREAVQGRPVRVIVTSRITLIDKAAIPAGATVIRLLEFDVDRRRQWTDVWNAHNAAYFARSGVRPFQPPTTGKLAALAEHPLLLLMLALYDSQENRLAGEHGLDQTLLYHSLLTRFIDREHRKGESGEVYAALRPDERMERVERDLQRLGVAAVGMFNRRQLHIHRDQLDADIDYFKLQRKVPVRPGARLTQADLLLGSFFFIHESRTRSLDPHSEGAVGQTAFEFLHNTFGEFLTADFLIGQLLQEANAIGLMRQNAALRSTLDQHLQALTDHWFACLMYTPLHTRPVILEMLREWLGHRVELDGMAPRDPLEDLDVVISAQLRMVLAGNNPPDIMRRQKETPFEPLPLLGHLAVYSLNLVVLRTVLAKQEFRFDESLLTTHEDGHRPWDQLTHLWRSWLPLESLVGLSAVITARRDGAAVRLRPRGAFGVPAGRSRLDDILNVSRALADDVTAGLAGLHVYDSPHGRVSPSDVEDWLAAGKIDLADEMTVRQAASDPRLLLRNDSLLSRLVGPGLGEELGNLSSLAAVILDAVASSPEMYSRCRSYSGPAKLDNLVCLRGAGAAALVSLCARLHPRWLPDLLGRVVSGDDADTTVRELATCDAAGAILAAAATRPANSDVLAFVRRLSELALDGTLSLRDPNACIQLAILSDETSAPELFEWAIAQLTAVLDGDRELIYTGVSADSLCRLVDLVLERSPRSASALRRIIAEAFRPSVMRGLPEALVIQLARLARQGDLAQDVVSAFYPEAELNRRTLLLLIRLVREFRQPVLTDHVLGLLGGPLAHGLADRRLRRGPGPTGADLTSRDVEDLRWLHDHIRSRPDSSAIAAVVRRLTGYDPRSSASVTRSQPSPNRRA